MTAVVIVLAYLLGSIPSGIWIGKYFYHTDIRTYGSGRTRNDGQLHVLGKKAGTIVLIMDMLKGSAATLLPIWLGAEIHLLLAGVVAALGHTYPLFAGFKGGKAVATSGGIILAYNPLFFTEAIIAFVIYLYFSRMVSLSSILVCFTAIFLSFFFKDWPLTIVTILLTVFIIYRHRSNIYRIKNGTESKVPFGYKSKSVKE